MVNDLIVSDSSFCLKIKKNSTEKEIVMKISLTNKKSLEEKELILNLRRINFY